MAYDGRVVLYPLDGTQLWSRAVAKVERVTWLCDGGRVLVNDSGIARLDPSDGM